MTASVAVQKSETWLRIIYELRDRDTSGRAIHMITAPANAITAIA